MQRGRLTILGALIVLVLPLAVSGGPPTTVFLGATLVDGTGAAPMADAALVVEGGRIVAVVPRSDVSVPEGATVVDATGKWITPGLIDAHIHYFQSGGLYTRPDVIDLRHLRSYEEELAEVDAQLDDTFRRYIASGVTAVVDVGGGFWNFKVRERANGTLLAPRTAVAGPLISTVSRPQLDIGDPPIIKADSPAMARAMVREQLQHHPDLIKIWFIVTADGNIGASTEIVRATVDEAHQAGVRVAVHATGLEEARASVEAGADILVHSVDDCPVDEAFIELVKTRGVVYTTTLIVREGYAEVLGNVVDLLDVERELGSPDVIKTFSELQGAAARPDLKETGKRRLERLARTMPVMQANLRAMQKGGTLIAAGTDAGNIGTLHGPAIHRELQLMAEAGLTPAEILVAATRNAALVFSAQPEIGTIEAGKLADMLILNADPLADVANLQRIHRVVKGGDVIDPAAILPPSPETMADRQLAAYNARDIEAFLACYASDVTVTRLPDEVIATSREAMRPRYATLFADNPELHCTIMGRIVHGNWVIDHELVTGVKGRPRLRAVAIYEVRDGLIQTVRFLPRDQ